MDSPVTEPQASAKRLLNEDTTLHPPKPPKKNKTEKISNTIPIMRGKFKQRWLTKHSSLIKRSDTASGMMVSCNVHAETRALGQVQSCLEKYVHELFPQHSLTWERLEGPLEIEGEEQEQETHGVKNKDKRFQAVDAACGGLVFYRFRIDIPPTQFLYKLIDHMTQQSKEDRQQIQMNLRHCARWIPLDFICTATTERIVRCFERALKVHFPPDIDPNTTVAIVTEIRNNISLDKQTIIQLIAPLIPPQLKIDLKHPTRVIFVTVFKSVCGLSVLENYYEKKKFNLASLLNE
ncbi:hypothetical protein BDF14DRAFT_1831050 [Spinellus fusiger]|nr:hypothetical protein BDF14DRAFT_1831050 [Spinellus fusiger]